MARTMHMVFPEQYLANTGTGMGLEWDPLLDPLWTTLWTPFRPLINGVLGGMPSRRSSNTSPQWGALMVCH